MWMAITIEAVYANGVLTPTQTLPLRENERVQVTILPAVSRVRTTAGLMGWTGSQEDADFIAMSPELEIQDDE